MERGGVLEPYETRSSIWFALSASLVCVFALAWHTMFNLSPMVESQGIALDSLRREIDTLQVREELKKKAWAEWQESFKRDEERKKNWDKAHPKYAPRK